MKKILIVLLLTILGISAKAQSVYKPFNPGLTVSGQTRQQTQTIQQTQTQSEIVRTNAYYADSDGNVYKVPIKVQIQNSYGIISIYVVEYYQNNGFQGRWYDKLPPVKASQCMPMYARNSLEKQFMYKALVGFDYWYFDL